VVKPAIIFFAEGTSMLNLSRKSYAMIVAVIIVFGGVGFWGLGRIGYAVFHEQVLSNDRTDFTREWSMDPAERKTIRRRTRDLPPLQSLIVARSDSTVLEFHRDGLSPEDPVNIKSASKSVLSALVGIALERGDLSTINQPLTHFFPEILGNASDAKQTITVRDVLLMRSGLESTSFENYGPWVTSNHWLRYALTRPMKSRPGSETNYSTGNSHIIAAVLSKATGRDLKDYAQDHLFDPLNVRIRAWQRSPEGYRFGGNNLSITTEAMLKFGRLYLNDGQWHGQQVVPADWVEESTARIVFDTHHGYPYGYFWWNARYHGLDVDFAWGHGGQYVFVVPERDLVVVTTSDLQSVIGTDDYTGRIHTLLKESILPATRD
jgi:CubicO group peptidase (beta-lactamase class C family)